MEMDWWTERKMQKADRSSALVMIFAVIVLSTALCARYVNDDQPSFWLIWYVGVGLCLLVIGHFLIRIFKRGEK